MKGLVVVTNPPGDASIVARFWWNWGSGLSWLRKTTSLNVNWLVDVRVSGITWDWRWKSIKLLWTLVRVEIFGVECYESNWGLNLSRKLIMDALRIRIIIIRSWILWELMEIRMPGETGKNWGSQAQGKSCWIPRTVGTA